MAGGCARVAVLKPLFPLLLLLLLLLPKAAPRWEVAATGDDLPYSLEEEPLPREVGDMGGDEEEDKAVETGEDAGGMVEEDAFAAEDEDEEFDDLPNRAVATLFAADGFSFSFSFGADRELAPADGSAGLIPGSFVGSIHV